MTYKDRLKGMFLGAVLGDAMGVPIEFLDKKQIFRKYGGSVHYLYDFILKNKAKISDETILLQHALSYFMQEGNYSFEGHLGLLSTTDEEQLQKKGFSRKMRNLFEHYSKYPNLENPYTDNSGAGFLPLVLPLVAKYDSLDELCSEVSEYASKTHVFDNVDEQTFYFSVLYSLLNDMSPLEVMDENFSSLVENDKTAIALSGNIEKINQVEGASNQILPFSVALYTASNRNYIDMLDISIRNFKKADFDTLFFATGALIGAAKGYDELLMQLVSRVDGIEEIEKLIDDYISTCADAGVRGNKIDSLENWLSKNLDDMFLTKGELFNLVPELQLQEGFNSGQPRHCYPLLEHTLRVVDAVPKEDMILRTAALLHDVSKPLTRGKTGKRTTYHNHAKTGEKMANEILMRLGYTETKRHFIKQLVGQHVINYNDQWSDRAIRRFKKKNRLIMDRLFTLVDADNSAQLPALSNLERLKMRLELIDEKESQSA